jgi:hypothetical protein
VGLSANPNIFTYEYDKIKENKKEINENLIKEMYKPERVMKWLNSGFDIECMYN